jgi:hypothetical protein
MDQSLMPSPPLAPSPEADSSQAHSSDTRTSKEAIQHNLGAIAQTVHQLAQDCTGNSLQLLALLRLLEHLHQDIRDTLFQDALPDTRQALYSLLRDIETTGGWPYIHRMRLQDLLHNLEFLPTPIDTAEPNAPPVPPSTLPE